MLEQHVRPQMPTLQPVSLPIYFEVTIRYSPQNPSTPISYKALSHASPQMRLLNPHLLAQPWVPGPHQHLASLWHPSPHSLFLTNKILT